MPNEFQLLFSSEQHPATGISIGIPNKEDGIPKYFSVVRMMKKAKVSKLYGYLDTIAFKFSPIPVSVRCMK